jgi:8-oxo-dGTP pyrophosphatase MutT (NUDIX family)
VKLGGIVVGAIVHLTDSQGKVLLQRRKTGALAGYVGLPGGKVNYGEDVVSAGLRELREETGLIAEDARLAGVYSEVSFVDGSADAHYVLFVVESSRFRGELLKETEEGANFWAKREEAASLSRVLPDLFFVLDEVQRAPFVNHLTRVFEDEKGYVVTGDGRRYPDSQRHGG